MYNNNNKSSALNFSYDMSFSFIFQLKNKTSILNVSLVNYEKQLKNRTLCNLDYTKKSTIFIDVTKNVVIRTREPRIFVSKVSAMWPQAVRNKCNP